MKLNKNKDLTLPLTSLGNRHFGQDFQVSIFAHIAIFVYYHRYHRALLVSRNFWGHYRAGDVPAAGPLIVTGVDTIDVTAASTDVFALNHSDYAQNNDLLTDIGKLIATGLRPPNVRFSKLKPVNAGEAEYWRYSAE